MCILFVTRTNLFLLAAIVFLISNALYGACFVFYYAWVPILTRLHPDVLDYSNTNPTPTSVELYKKTEEVGNLVSSRGFLVGYVASVFLLMVGASIQIGMDDGRHFGLPEVYPLQIGVAFTCLWFLFFLIFAMRWMKPRPGPALKPGESYATHSIKQVGKSLYEARRLSELFKFLIAWFIYSDGFTTVDTVAILFFQSYLGLDQTSLLIAAVLTAVFAGIGCVVWNFIQVRSKWSTKSILMTQSFMYLLLPIYGLIGFVTPPGSFGVSAKWEIWPLAAYHGFLFGATQSACRVQFSELIPIGREAQFFSLYEITDKGSAWIGPLIVGAIGQATGNLRYSFFFLLAFLMIPIGLFWSVDVEKGKMDALNFAKMEAEELDIDLDLDDSTNTLSVM